MLALRYTTIKRSDSLHGIMILGRIMLYDNELSTYVRMTIEDYDISSIAPGGILTLCSEPCTQFTVITAESANHSCAHGERGTVAR